MTSPTITLDPISIQQIVDQAVEQRVITAIDHLAQDPAWLEKIERQINQAVVQRTVAQLSQLDIGKIIREHVEESMQQKIITNFASNGIEDRATTCQLTVMDESTVVENQLTARELAVVGVATIKNLIVKGSINTDNRSWNELKDDISQRTLTQLTEQWREKLVADTIEKISEQGIKFEEVSVGGYKLVEGNRLSDHIQHTNIKSLGMLDQLNVKGGANIHDTLHVVNQRIGINTGSPEMALSIWDEEVSLTMGKYKAKQAWLGTSRDQGLALGVNRTAQLEIDSDGLTTVKKLRVGLHRISHASEVPGYAGTRGDIVFNSNPGPDHVFAWVCLGAHKWQSLKSAE